MTRMPSLARLGVLAIAIATIVATPAAASTVLHLAQPAPHLAQPALDADQVGVRIDPSALHIVTGFSLTPASEMRAFVWRDGVMSDLGPVNRGFARATDINNRGQVIGDGSVDGMNSVPVLWQKGTVRELTEHFGTATAINDRGQVTGLYFGGSGSFVWSDGRLTDLPTLPGATFTQAHGINNHGQIVGYTDFDAFLWQGGRMTALPRLTTGNATAQDINDRGQIVGESSTSPTGGDSHAVLWTR